VPGGADVRGKALPTGRAFVNSASFCQQRAEKS
jgi:hypothetical protein